MTQTETDQKINESSSTASGLKDNEASNNFNELKTKIKNANAAGQGAMERSDENGTDVIPPEPANEENNNE